MAETHLSAEARERLAQHAGWIERKLIDHETVFELSGNAARQQGADIAALLSALTELEGERERLREALAKIGSMRIGVNAFIAAQMTFELARDIAPAALTPEETNHG